MKAVSRAITKTLLGWCSFLTMAATRRHQTLHDLLTGSTVQIRDATKAEPRYFAQARAPLSGSAPSISRRILVIIGYLIMCALLAGIVLVRIDIIRCSNSAGCLAAKRTGEIIIELVWLAASAALIGLGRRGRLWGARTPA